MENYQVVLTETDKSILNSYSMMLEGLSKYLGEGYEIVLHSLEDYGNSAVKIIHGSHTGRTKGAPVTDLAMNYLEEIKKNPDDSTGITYFTHNKKGQSLKSVTIPVRGENNRIIGLLCINFNLHTSLLEYIHNFVDGETNEEQQWETRKENFSSTSVELLENMIQEMRREVMEDLTVSSVNKNKEIIQRLYEKGLFNMKDAVAKAADILGISKNTVYLHLRNLESNDKL